MDKKWQATMQQQLREKKLEFNTRLERITDNLRSGLVPDSEERAKQLEDREVVDALGNAAREELRKISAALERLDDGMYGTCIECSVPIAGDRLRANPYALKCIDCAEIDEETPAHTK